MQTYIFAPNAINHNMNQKSITIGMYGGLAAITIGLITYFGGIELMTSWWVLGIFMFLPIVFMIWAGRAARNITGFISLRDAFISVFIAAVIISFMNAVYGFALVKIDGELEQKITDQMIYKTESLMEWANTPDSEIDKRIAQLEKDMPGEFSLIGQLKSLLFRLVRLAIISIVIAAIIKKNPPVFTPDSEIIDN